MEFKIKGFPTTADILLVMFIWLKATGTVGWSWWVVLMPMYIPLIIVGIGTFISMRMTGDHKRTEELRELLKQASAARREGQKFERRAKNDREAN